MFDFLDGIWDKVVESVSSINLTSVATSALTSSLVGAGVGALASAVSDGDIGEGLLYGATGGLVTGGLASFGSEFFDEWNKAGTTATGDWSTTEIVSPEGIIETDLEIDPTEGMEALATTKGADGTGTGLIKSSSLEEYFKPRGMVEVLGPTALTLAGGFLKGAFSDSAADQKIEVMEAQWDHDKELANNRVGALNSVYQPKGTSITTKTKTLAPEIGELRDAVTVTV